MLFHLFHNESLFLPVFVLFFLNQSLMKFELFLYHGYDMSNTSKYIIDCKDCPKKVKVFHQA